MILCRVALVVSLMVAAPVFAADSGKRHQADVAGKTAQIEALRARASHVSSPSVSAGLIEADDLLRRLRDASPEKRDILRAQLEAAMARIELDIGTDAWSKP